MSKLFIEDTSLTAIGDAIRGKTGGTELLSVPTGMVDAINSITTSEDECALKCAFSISAEYPTQYSSIYTFDLGGKKFPGKNCLVFFRYFSNNTGTWNDYMRIPNGGLRNINNINTSYGFHTNDDFGEALSSSEAVSMGFMSDGTIEINHPNGDAAPYIAVFYIE